MEAGVVDLGGEWMVRADPEDRGLSEGWQCLDSWPRLGRTMEIPAPMQRALGADHRGVAWIARRVCVPGTTGAGERMWIRFEAVATDATVWVEGVEVGRHVGDYVPFQFEITKAARSRGAGSEIGVVVRVDQMHAPRPAPGVLTENGHITKGFHDVLSIQHSGVWDRVSLRRTGPATIVPNGLRVIADAASRSVRLRAEFDCPSRGQHVSFTIRDPDGEPCGSGTDLVPDQATSWKREFHLGNRGDIHLYSADSGDPNRLNLAMGAQDRPTRKRMQERVVIEEWSPESPRLYSLVFDLVSGQGSSELVEVHELRFGFRTIATGGPDHRQVLLNGKPRLIRGVLHWGHEPDHMAPSPTREQVKDEFARLKEAGFNCVCLCMWYPPEYYYDIADEMGMFIWQEHPVWKSRMGPEFNAEYRRMYEQFFRRDARHPAVIIVSGSCEHESFDKELAAWWWARAREMLPDKLVQVQTAFLGWTNPEQTDLHDEHVYDSSGRWVRFIEDVRAATAELPRKPFVMGETIIGTAWVDTSRRELHGEWWHPKGTEECRAFEERVRTRYGEATLERFRRGAHKQNLAIRKYQSEALRGFEGCAGWVMNQIRDVPAGRLGFMDDYGAWRFDPDELRPWLADAAILVRTPGGRLGFIGGTTVSCEVGVSNFGSGAVSCEIGMSAAVEVRKLGRVRVECQPGDVTWSPLPIVLWRTTQPRVFRLVAEARGLPENSWDLVVMPEPDALPGEAVRLTGLEYSEAEQEPDFEERAYSSGWGLKCRSWQPILPTAEDVAAELPSWNGVEPLAGGLRVVVSHRLNPGLIDFMVEGGRVVLLANKTPAGLGAKFINVWGQCPLIPEEGPLAAGDSEWVSTLLHMDLMDRHPRAIPVDELGIAEQVSPIVRMVFTHDSGVPRMFDAAFRTRVGKGLLLTGTVDPTTAAGQFFVRRLMAWAARDDADAATELKVEWLRGWISGTLQ